MSQSTANLHDISNEELISRLVSLSDVIRFYAEHRQDSSLAWIHDKWDAINIELGRRGL